MGGGCIIKRGSKISENVLIEDNVELYRNVVLGKDVKVGACTSINDSSVIECGSIGRFCSIGVDVIIGLGVHPLNYVTSSTLALRVLGIKQELNLPPPIIEDDVWIGSRALIMRGVTVHTGAVIGAGAVVTKDVPPYAIVAGVPAKVLKYRFDEVVISRMLEINIWRKNRKDFIKKLIEAGDGFVSLLIDGQVKNVD